MHPTDSVLIDQWMRRRDPEAMRQIVSRYAGLVYGASLRILRTPEEAQDATQDCFLKLHGLQEPVHSLPAFLHTLATRQSLNRIRAESRRRLRETAYALEQEAQTSQAWDEVQQFVDEAIAELPETYRAVLVRHYLQGETHAAVAQDLGLTRSGVTRRCERGIEKVRQRLADRGVIATAVVLGSGLAAQQSQALPPTLQASLGRVAIAGASAPTLTKATAAATWLGWLPKAAVLTAVLAGALAMTFWWSGKASIDAAMPASPETSAAASGTAKLPPAPAAEPQVLSAAAPIVSPVAQNSAGQGITGRVLSDTGFIRPTTYLSTNWPIGIYRGALTDAEGRFTLEGKFLNGRPLMAYCQYTQRGALVPASMLTPGATLEVVLDRRLLGVMGRVATPDGQGVPKTPVELRITSADGEEFLSEALYADKEGYYRSDDVPVKTGDAVEVRLAECQELAAGPWSSPMKVLDYQVNLAPPPLLVDAKAAEYILKNQSLAELSGCLVDTLVNAPARETLGGFVQDETGKGVPGAVVEIMWATPNHMVDVFTTSTDPAGKWSCVVPKDPELRGLSADHPAHVAWPLLEERGIPELDALRAGTAVLTLPRGIALQGQVVDEHGAPLGDVLVLTHNRYSRTPGGSEAVTNAPMEDATTTRTDAQGRFQLNCLPEGEFPLEFLSWGRPPVTEVLNISRGMAPVTVRITPGTTLRGRVVDGEGNPVPYAALRGEQRIHDGQESSLQATADADEQGSFVMENVPEEGELHIQVGVPKEKRQPGFNVMSATIVFPEKRDMPFLVPLYAAPKWQGRALDAETNTPITKFEVKSGMVDKEGKTYWGNFGKQDKETSDGNFEYALKGWHPTHNAVPEDAEPEGEGTYIISVQAEGYLAETGPALKPGESAGDLEFRLTPHAPITGTVVDTTGAAVPGANVAWVPTGQAIAFVKTKLQDYTGSLSLATTGADGTFSLPAQNGPAVLIGVHELGWGQLNLDTPPSGIALILEPWAEVEITVLSQGEPAAEKQVVLAPPDWFSRAHQINWSAFGKTGEDGRVLITQVPPVPLLAGLMLGSHSRRDLSGAQRITPRAGERTTVRIGEGGCTVSGSLSIADAGLWERFDPKRLHFMAYAGVLPENERERDLSKTYVAEVDTGGAFSFSGLPAGEYEAWARYDSPPPYRGEDSIKTLAEARMHFAVAQEGEDIVLEEVILLTAPE